MKTKLVLMVVLLSVLVSGCGAFEVRDTRPQGVYSAPRVIVRERIIIRSISPPMSREEYYQRKFGGDFYKHCNWGNSFCDGGPPVYDNDRRGRDDWHHDNDQRRRDHRRR